MRIADRALLALVATVALPLGAHSASSQSAPRSGMDTATFDRTVRPQDDFYQFVNGGWLARHPIPVDASRWGTFEEVGERSRTAIRDILERAARSHAPRGSDEQKVGDLYASFMDSSRIESLGVAPLREELDRIAAMKSTSELPAELARIARLGIWGPMIAVRVRPDAKASSQNAVYIEPTGFPRDFFLRDDARMDSVRRGIVRFKDRLLSLAGRHTPGAGERGLALSIMLARRQWDGARTRDPDATYNPMTVEQLMAATPHFDWRAYFAEAGLQEVGRVIVTQPDYLTLVDSLVSVTPIATLQEALATAILGALAGDLSTPFADAAFDFYGKVLGGEEAQRPRWKRAQLEVEFGLGDALGRLYVARYFTPATKARVDMLIRNVREAYRSGIDSLDWMTPHTRAQASEKLARLRVKVGYPERGRDYSTVTIRRDDLVGNMIRLRAREYREMIDQLGKPVDRERWLFGVTPQTVDAYYSQQNNEMAYPAALMQPPLFDPDADDAVNYGAIGAVIGHEIGHAFDDQGRRFDSEGNLRDWWTADDARAFEDRAARLGAQYEALPAVEGMSVNGRRTMGENIGDLSGLAQAYRAYRKSLKGKEPPVIDGFTGDQRFFIGYAQMRRTGYRDAALRQMLSYDTHAPARHRTLVPLMNSNAFQRAFDVRAGDGMYLPPERRVHIW